MKFEVGNKIRMVGAYDVAQKGVVGIIRGFEYPRENGRYAVEFNKSDLGGSGHSCDKIIASDSGLWIPEDCMELLEGSTVIPSTTTASPIMRFESQQQLDESLAEWQSRLLLSDWIIMAKLVNPEELVKDGIELTGFNDSEATLMTSLISIADGEFTDTITKVCAEESLVHELLHLKLPMFIVDGSIESCLYNSGVHATIEQLAKSLLMAKYKLSLSWFKNF